MRNTFLAALALGILLGASSGAHAQDGGVVEWLNGAKDKAFAAGKDVLDAPGALAKQLADEADRRMRAMFNYFARLVVYIIVVLVLTPHLAKAWYASFAASCIRRDELDCADGAGTKFYKPYVPKPDRIIAHIAVAVGYGLAVGLIGFFFLSV